MGGIAANPLEVAAYAHWRNAMNNSIFRLIAVAPLVLLARGGVIACEPDLSYLDSVLGHCPYIGYANSDAPKFQVTNPVLASCQDYWEMGGDAARADVVGTSVVEYVKNLVNQHKDLTLEAIRLGRIANEYKKEMERAREAVIRTHTNEDFYREWMSRDRDMSENEMSFTIKYFVILRWKYVKYRELSLQLACIATGG